MINMIDAVKKLAPSAAPAYLAGFTQIDLFDKYAVNSPLRRAHFCAQVFGETGALTVLQENMNYSAGRLFEIFGPGKSSAAIGPVEASQLAHHPEQIAERVYGAGNPHMAKVLGNTEPGDGWTFRGIGPLQSTGRAAAVRWGNACNADFAGNVLLMLSPALIMLPSFLEWSAGNCNALADMNDVRRIRHVINGGYNGLTDVEQWLDKFWALLRPDAQQDHWQAAIPSSDTASVQKILNTLGYQPPFSPDGRYGPATKLAVLWFQRIAGLTQDGIAGPVTYAAMSLRLNSMSGSGAADKET
jgi:putative chitinase